MEFGNMQFVLLLLTLFIIGQENQRASAHRCDESSSSSEECECECRPKKDKLLGFSPSGVQLYVNSTQLRVQNPTVTGGCDCNDNSTKIYLTPQRSGCNYAVVGALVQCSNFSELCVKGNDDVYYALANSSQLQDSNYFNTIIFFYSLCEHDQTNCNVYMTLVHFNRLKKNRLEGMSLRSLSNGKLWTFPSVNNPPVFGSISGLLSVDAISCHGCDVIRSSNGCIGTFEDA